MTMKSVTILLFAVVLASTGCSKTARASSGAPGSPGAPEDSTQASADDQQKLQGTWRMESAMYSGQPMMNDVRWIFDGDHMTIVLKGNYEAGVKANFQLGTGDKPNTILIKYFDNPLANQGYYGGSYTGIYKLSGDKLRVCY